MDASASSTDPAIVSAIGAFLSVTPEACRIQPNGGAGFSSSFKVTVEIHGTRKHFFVKCGPAAAMFKGEHCSLEALHLAVPTICPASLAHGPMTDSSEHFLLTEYVQLRGSGGGGASGSGLSLAQKLAKLHTSTAPVPDGYLTPQFGFPVVTYCGSTPQNNDFCSSWPSFFGNNRLRELGKILVEKYGPQYELQQWIEKTATEVVPQLLDPKHLGGLDGIVPVLVHGDLWSGNKAQGVIGDQGNVEDVIFDPSSCYAHSEYEIGIMKMFGGFPAAFFGEYHRMVPKTAPEEEYDDRIELYQLYHHLNHYFLFGGGYNHSAMDIMQRLCRKYKKHGH